MIYIINIIMLILWDKLLLNNGLKKKIFCIIATTQWILLSGLRHISIGTDTKAYFDSFELTKSLSWETIINQFNEIMFNDGIGKDPGYAIFEKITQYVTDDYQVYLIIIALIFMIPLGILIYKYSKDALVSFLIYSCLFYAFFAITGHRQTVATGIGLFIAYEFIKRKKFIYFLLVVLIASTIHKSIICIIPFYFIANKKITYRYSIIMLTTFVIVFIFKNRILSFLTEIVGYEEYATQYQGAGTFTFTVIFILVILVALWRAPIILKEYNEDIIICYNAAFMALIFIPFTYIDPSTMRIVQYFSIFIMLLIPEIINSFVGKERRLVRYTAVALMLLLVIRSNPYYIFFWQGGN